MAAAVLGLKGEVQQWSEDVKTPVLVKLTFNGRDRQ